jgi:hypothetical protein
MMTWVLFEGKDLTFEILETRNSSFNQFERSSLMKGKESLRNLLNPVQNEVKMPSPPKKENEIRSRSLNRSFESDLIFPSPMKPKLQNAWEERENTPIKGKSSYYLPDDILEEAPSSESPPPKSGEKREYLKRKTKYDPKMSIETEKFKRHHDLIEEKLKLSQRNYLNKTSPVRDHSQKRKPLNQSSPEISRINR